MANTIDVEILTTLPDAARELGLSPTTLREQIRQGRLNGAIQIGRSWYVTREVIDAYKAERLGKYGPKGGRRAPKSEKGR